MRLLTQLNCCFTLLAAVALVGCGGGADAPADDHADSAEAGKPGMALPESVRRNLGVSFEKAQTRRVAQTMRVPGHFELLPSARRDSHSALSGRVELRVVQYQQVEAGDVIARIDSPQWHDVQAKLAAAQADVITAKAKIVTAKAHLAEQRQLIELLDQRVKKLAAAEVRRVELETQLSQARLALPRLEAEAEAAVADVRSAGLQLRSQVLIASSLTGESAKQLMAEAQAQPGEEAQARWQAIERIEVRAEADGVVESLSVTSGQWVETGAELMTIIAPRRLRFRAEALQADLGRLRDGLPVSIAPPLGTNLATEADAVKGTLLIDPKAHAEDRSIALYTTPGDVPAWARAGVAGYLEIDLNPQAQPVLAIPRRAVVRDGLEFVFFRRDPNDPDRVYRVTADTGDHDGRWVEVRSGVRDGDQVVIDGVYQLLAASSSGIQKGGHFHADGTWHEEDH